MIIVCTQPVSKLEPLFLITGKDIENLFVILFRDGVPVVFLIHINSQYAFVPHTLPAGL